jgi:hypothetical protein
MKEQTITRTALVFMLFIFQLLHADELSLATGSNVSFYKAWHQQNAEYQKTDILNPIAVFYVKQFIDHFGLYTALQFTRKTIYDDIGTTRLDYQGSIVPDRGMVGFKKTHNYLSLEVAPLYLHRIGKFRIETRAGLSGDVYLNERENIDDGFDTLFRSGSTRPFVLCLTGGIGTGYQFRKRFVAGVRTGISRSLTEIFDRQSVEAELYFVNWMSTVYAGILF